jgi:cytochrome c oxidase accessory protein FixG
LSSKNIFELDPERLGTTDEHGNRVYLYPEDVKGDWGSRRKTVYWFLILLYLVLPWIYINGKPALMIDIFHQQFTVMGQTLHGVEPILFFLLAASGIFMVAFLTSLLGRVWCGWACPQTVFIQSIFWKIEAFFEGNPRQRREFDKAPWDLNKFLRRSGKWLAFLLVSLHIAHTFIGYFIGPRELFEITMHAPTNNWGIFLATMILTSIFLLDFGWFREQFCIIACPYGRMQSVLMDDNSLVVSYDIKRGEPRRGTVEKGQEGDCINCYNCVKVCPTGIDIRRGTQLECIACTKCIDACDDIMTKIKKPRGLIRYSSENEILGKSRKKLPVRSVIYVTISLIFISLFGYFLNASTNINMVFLRSRIPFQMIESEKRVLNHFTLKLSHQGSEEYKVEFQVNDPLVSSRIQVITNSHPTVLNKPEMKIPFFFKFDQSILINGNRTIKVQAYDPITKQIKATKEITLVGPVR